MFGWNAKKYTEYLRSIFLECKYRISGKKNYFFAEIFFCTIFKNLIIILFNVLRSIQCLGSRLPYRQHRNHHGNFTPFKRDYFQTIAHLIELKKLNLLELDLDFTWFNIDDFYFSILCIHFFFVSSRYGFCSVSNITLTFKPLRFMLITVFKDA